MYHFIVNVYGGGGRARRTWEKIQKILAEYKVEYKAYVSESKGHLTQIAKEVSSLPEDEIKIVVVGGDGTIDEVVNGITDFNKVKMGVVPTGSGNDFVRGLNLPKHFSSIRKALDLILKSDGSKKIDLGKVTVETGESWTYAISSGFGMDAIVCQKTINSKLKSFLNKIHLGKLTYVLLTLQTIFSMKYFKIKCKFDDGEEKEFNKVIFFAGMNLPAEGGGVKMTPDALVDDGKLSLLVTYGFPQPLAFIVFPFLILGIHTKLKGFYLKDFKSMEVEMNEKQVLHRDGEYSGDFCKAKYECLNLKLSMLI